MRNVHPLNVDFAPSRLRGARISPAAAAILLAGLGACVWVASVLQPRWDQLQSLRATADRIDAARAEAGRDTPARLDRTRPADAARFAEAQRIAADLHRPWPALFDAIESAGQRHVHVTRMGVDGRFSGVSIQVEARALGDVVRYAQHLAATGLPITNAQLASHEWTGTTVRVVSARVSVALDPRPRGQSAAQVSAARLAARETEVPR